MQSAKKNVLFCIVGMSPAILSETIWALATKEDPIIVDEVYTLTTLSGKNKLEEVMLKRAPKAKKNQWEIFKDKLSKKIKVDLSDKMFLTESILFKGLILDSDNTRSYRTQLKKVLEKASISKLVIDTILPYGRSLNVSIKDKNRPDLSSKDTIYSKNKAASALIP